MILRMTGTWIILWISGVKYVACAVLVMSSKNADGHRIAGNSIASLTFAGGELPV